MEDMKNMEDDKSMKEMKDMKKHMKDVKTSLVAALVVALVAAAPLAAQSSPSKPAPGVAGNWDVAIAMPDGTLPATMTLALDGKKVTGTFNSEHSGEVPVEGQLADGKLTFSVVVHSGSAQEMKIDFTGALKADGTLAGTMTWTMGEMTWTASRAKSARTPPIERLR